MKRLLIMVTILALAVPISASELFETYYPFFQEARAKLERKLILEEDSYRIELNYRKLLTYLEDCDVDTRRFIGSIALDWNLDVEFPELSELTTKAGREQLAKAILTAEMRAILKAVESIEYKGKVWL